MGMRFLRTPIADCRIGQGLQNRRAPVATVRSTSNANDNRMHGDAVHRIVLRFLGMPDRLLLFSQ
jgi:hypothetical protein